MKYEINFLILSFCFSLTCNRLYGVVGDRFITCMGANMIQSEDTCQMKGRWNITSNAPFPTCKRKYFTSKHNV